MIKVPKIIEEVVFVVRDGKLLTIDNEYTDLEKDEQAYKIIRFDTGKIEFRVWKRDGKDMSWIDAETYLKIAKILEKWCEK